jgi:hypothetical protein
MTDMIARIDKLEREVARLTRKEVPGWEINQKLTVAAANFTFSAIPQYARHLMIVSSLRSATAAATDFAIMQINGIGGAVYDRETSTGVGAVNTTAETLAATAFLLANITGATATAGYFASNIAWMMDYAAAKAPTLFTMGGRSSSDAAGNIVVANYYLKCRTVGAVTSIVITTNTGANFAADSEVTLYGIG